MKKKLYLVLMFSVIAVCMIPSLAFADTTLDNNNEVTLAGEDGEVRIDEPEVDPEIGENIFIAQGKSYSNAIKYTWSPVPGAVSYKVYLAKCGKTEYKVVKTTDELTFTKKKLKAKTAYKAYVIAYDPSGEEMLITPRIHNITKHGKKSNATTVTAMPEIGLDLGQHVNMEAKITGKDSSKKLSTEHVRAPLRCYSSDPAVATVDDNGNIIGVAGGVAIVYAVAPSGAYAKCWVHVRGEVDPGYY